MKDEKESHLTWGETAEIVLLQSHLPSQQEQTLMMAQTQEIKLQTQHVSPTLAGCYPRDRALRGLDSLGTCLAHPASTASLQCSGVWLDSFILPFLTGVRLMTGFQILQWEALAKGWSWDYHSCVWITPVAPWVVAPGHGLQTLLGSFTQNGNSLPGQSVTQRDCW